MQGRLWAANPDNHDLPIITKPVMNRITRAGNWLSRCSGSQEWVKHNWQQLDHAQSQGKEPATLTFGHCNFIHLLETPDHARAIEQSREPFLRVMGTPSLFEHLQQCYMIGSIDRINARISDLVDAGLQYLVLGPVTDDPKQIDMLARHVATKFA